MRRSPLAPREDAGSRSLLLDAAEKLFASKGYAGTSVRDIAKESKLNLSLISYYFGSKEQLFAALMEERVTFLEHGMEAQFAQAKGPWQQLRVLVNNVVQKLFYNRNLHRIIIREMTIPDSEVAHGIVRKKSLRNAGQLMAFIDQGMAKGDFRRLDPAMVGLTLYGLVSHYVLFRSNLAALRGERRKPSTQLGDRDRTELEGYLYDLLVRLLRPNPKNR
jgi:AcrR family transcriptional regulator